MNKFKKTLSCILLYLQLKLNVNKKELNEKAL